MDDTDQKIIAALRINARATISELALELNLSRATVRAHMEKLTANEEILGYTVILKGDAQELPVRGVILIEIAGKGNERIIATLRRFPEIQSIHSTNGRWDLVVEFGVDTLVSLDAILRRIRLIDGITASETNLYLTTHRSIRAKPAP